MEQVLDLSLQQQNNLVSGIYTLIEQIKWDNKAFAAENDTDLVEYLLADFDASPENWNNCFEFSYDEVSAAAKAERRNIIERLLNF